MSLVKLIASSSKRELGCLSKRYLETVSPVACDKVFLQKEKSVQFYGDPLLQSQARRLIHTTGVNRDLESALKCVAAGVAATGVIGPGVGLGLIFGNMVQATARNPSAANKIFQVGILGSALCESIAFFALMIAFIAMS